MGPGVHWFVAAFGYSEIVFSQRCPGLNKNGTESMCGVEQSSRLPERVSIVSAAVGSVAFRVGALVSLMVAGWIVVYC